MRVTQMPASKVKENYKSGGYTEFVQPVEKRRGESFDLGKLFSRLEKDDYILAGIILVLVMEGCDDYILLAALGYLLFMGLKE